MNQEEYLASYGHTPDKYLVKLAKVLTELYRFNEDTPKRSYELGYEQALKDVAYRMDLKQGVVFNA